MDTFNNDEERHAYADWILKDVQMLWHDNDPAVSTYLLVYFILFDIIYLKPGHKKKGLWLNEVFLKTLAVHYTALQGTVSISAFGDPKGIRPIGTMGLCAALVK